MLHCTITEGRTGSDLRYDRARDVTRVARIQNLSDNIVRIRGQAC